MRDGGYYTNWDFDEDLVQEYFAGINSLPIDFVEIGYRSKLRSEYSGAFYYLPEFVLEKVKKLTDKKLVIILNEKEISVCDLEGLLKPCIGLVSLIRLAVAPQNLQRALKLARETKTMGFEVSFNLMYASQWHKHFPCEKDLQELDENIDYLYVVDSYGGMYPGEVKEVILDLKKNTQLKIGFHGHNNLEMALANSLAAMEAGADIIDATLGGMGRGAGNLKTELLLTVLHQQRNLAVDFDALNRLSNRFQELKEIYKWGGNLAYMASGAFSLPQKTVFSQLKKRYFSLNAIIAEVSNINKDDKKVIEIPGFKDQIKVERLLVVGGGQTVKKYAEALQFYLAQHSEIGIIHSSSKNIGVFQDMKNLQYHCLPGMEGKRFEGSYQGENSKNHVMIFPPKEFALSEYIPAEHRQRSFRLENLPFLPNAEVSATAMALEIARQLSAKEVLLTGYDGYDDPVTREELELYEENEKIFNIALNDGLEIIAVTPSKYHLSSKSIYALA